MLGSGVNRGITDCRARRFLLLNANFPAYDWNTKTPNVKDDLEFDFEVHKFHIQWAAETYKSMVFVARTHKAFSFNSEVWDHASRKMIAQDGRITQNYLQTMKSELARVPG